MYSVASTSRSEEESQNRTNELNAILQKLSPTVSEDAVRCIHNLFKFVAAPSEVEFPTKKLAGVLVLLHINPLGNLSVTLTTRSMKLRSHPGDTALAGGRFEDEDITIEQTALREAFEEIGLPLTPSTSLFHLTTLPAFTSRTLLVVIPVVYLITVPAPSILSQLVPNPDEVDKIFHLPLKSFLGLDILPRSSRTSTTSKVEPGHELLSHSHEDFSWLEEREYRLHSFEHPSFPSVTGLTADILLSVALIGYYGLTESEEVAEGGGLSNGVRRIGFERRAKEQMSWKEIVEVALHMQGTKGLKDNRRSTT